jgi:hypothetical protein
MIKRQKGFLRQILGLLALAHQAVQHPVDLSVVAQKQLLKRRIVSSAHSIEKLFVCVDHQETPSSP